MKSKKRLITIKKLSEMYFESYSEFLNRFSEERYNKMKTQFEKDGGYDPEKHGYIKYNEKGLEGKPVISNPGKAAILLSMLKPTDTIAVIEHWGRRPTPMAEQRQKQMQSEYIIKHNEGKKYNP